MNTQTILVTGGAGFIASNIIDELLLKNNNVICIDNFDPFYSKELKLKNINHNLENPNFQFVEGDIRDEVLLRNVFSQNKIDIVLHFAAKAGVRPSILNPKVYYEVNTFGTITILQIMKEFGVKKIIFSSSSSVYGNNEKIPFCENDIVDNPISPYAASKKSAELVIHTYHHLFGIDALILRFFTVYGKRQRPDLAINKFFNHIINSMPIEIFGDGKSSRDYTYIDDIVDGVEKAINYLNTHNNIYEIINFGNNYPISLMRLVELIENVTGKKFELMFKSAQDGDVFETCADITKAKQLLKFDPQTKIEDGLRETFNYFL